MRDDSLDNISRSQWISTIDYLELADLFRVLENNKLIIKNWIRNQNEMNIKKKDKLYLTPYGSVPSTSGQTSVLPWTTKSTLKWSMSSLVTLYGAPITTSSTYLIKKRKLLFVFNKSIYLKNNQGFKLTLHAKTLNVLSWTFIIG